jgi:hypothetical protein
MKLATQSGKLRFACVPPTSQGRGIYRLGRCTSPKDARRQPPPTRFCEPMPDFVCAAEAAARIVARITKYATPRQLANIPVIITHRVPKPFPARQNRCAGTRACWHDRGVTTQPRSPWFSGGRRAARGPFAATSCRCRMAMWWCHFPCIQGLRILALRMRAAHAAHRCLRPRTCTS